MFGLGYFEIGLILLVLIVIFGGRRIGRMLGKGYGTYQKVENTRKQFSIAGLLGLNKQDNNNKKQ